MKGASLTCFALNPDFASMTSHERLSNKKSQTQTIFWMLHRLNAIITVEDFRYQLRGYSDSLISNRDVHSVHGLSHKNSNGGIGRRVFGRIHKEIGDDLAKTHQVNGGLKI